MKHRTRTNGARQTPKNHLTTGDVLGGQTARVSHDINPKWARHYRALVSLRNRLLEERAQRRAQVAQPLEPHSMDMADSASDQFDHDLALSEMSAEQDMLYEVEAALKRILNGAYGICEETGRPIPTARLRAIPWTRFLREVELRLEARQLVSTPHLGTVGSTRTNIIGNLEESESGDERQQSIAEDESLPLISLAALERQLESNHHERSPANGTRRVHLKSHSGRLGETAQTFTKTVV